MKIEINMKSKFIKPLIMMLVFFIIGYLFAAIVGVGANLTFCDFFMGVSSACCGLASAFSLFKFCFLMFDV